jgi:uncharacterized protein (DUF1778 family)
VAASIRAKSARLEARISAEQKALIERAAAYEGRSVSDFVVQAVQREAKAIVEGHEVLKLDAAQSKKFVEDLLRSTKPNAALKRAAAEYKRRVTSE